MLQTLAINLPHGTKTVHSTGVVIYDHVGNPLVAVIEHQPGVTVITTINEGSRFQEQLRLLGLGDLQVPQITKIESPPVPAGYSPVY